MFEAAPHSAVFITKRCWFGRGGEGSEAEGRLLAKEGRRSPRC